MAGFEVITEGSSSQQEGRQENAVSRSTLAIASS
jgi:hypothetical protein